MNHSPGSEITDRFLRVTRLSMMLEDFQNHLYSFKNSVSEDASRALSVIRLEFEVESLKLEVRIALDNLGIKLGEKERTPSLLLEAINGMSDEQLSPSQKALIRVKLAELLAKESSLEKIFSYCESDLPQLSKFLAAVSPRK